MIREDFLVFGAPDIRESEIAEVVDTLRSGWLGTGPKVLEFEENIKTYKDSSFATAVNSCTAGLHLSLIVAGIQAGDEVITTPMTFCATINAIIHAGGTPVLADIDPLTKNISVSEIEKKITDKTKAIVPVHFAGYPCDMDRIMELAANHNLKVIEDCAHAIETTYKGRKVGSIGDFGCLSFYVTKNIVTGEGGMILCKREEDAARLKILALHGMTKDAWNRFGSDGYKHYRVVECGYKYNMMDIQAALGIHQLKRVEENWLKRQKIWRQYQEAFSDLPISLPPEAPSDCRHGYHLYTIGISSESGLLRDDVLNELTKRKIGSGVHYQSVTEQPFYQENYGWKVTDCPIAYEIGQQSLSLPLSSKLTQEDVLDVIQAVKQIVS